MRADPAAYTLVRQPTLAATLELLAEGTHTPLAGGTELMVAFNAGRLPVRPLVSIAHLPELRFQQAGPETIIVGGATTFADVRRSPEVSAALPLLALAASWTGTVANQNRATLAGNLCNASPAADSAPALLVYDAELELISTGGSRTIPLREFFLGYKRTALRAGELLYSIRIPRPAADLRGTLRKVGTRNAQAISKVAVGTLLRVHRGRVDEVRLAAASLGPVPMRLRATEQALLGRTLSPETVGAACTVLLREAKPIDDIRSTGRYRAAVAANLLRNALAEAGGLPPSG